jgi:hypothetical protein
MVRFEDEEEKAEEWYPCGWWRSGAAGRRGSGEAAVVVWWWLCWDEQEPARVLRAAQMGWLHAMHAPPHSGALLSFLLDCQLTADMPPSHPFHMQVD